MRVVRLASILVSLTLTAAILAGCNELKSEAAKTEPQAPKVTVAQPITRTVADEDEYVGRFVAVDTVEIRARISGYLSAIHFRDGQMVEKGDPLFTIDRRPFETALEQARANLEHSRANLSFAESDLTRGQTLVRSGTITEQSLDQRIQAKRVGEAAVRAREAEVHQATLDLQYTELSSPIAGHIGDRRVSTGNLVTGGTGGNTTLLATIESVDPIRFEFTMDEASYRRFMAVHKGLSGLSKTVAVKLKLIDQDSFVQEGRMDFIDNAINRSSGTIRARAEFPNPDGKLTPGMFGRIRIPMSPPASALLVPDEAIGTEQVRKFVYVVNGENVAQPKYVELGPLVDGLRVIKTGIAAGDRVIIKGLMRARPGTKVAPEAGEIASAEPEAPATKQKN
jgi:RND family efflux transporter MFP subunit